MKKILLILFTLTLNIYSKDIANNEYIYNEVEKIVLTNIDRIKETLNNLDDDEINLGFYTSKEYSKSKEKLNLTIKEALVNEKKINILSEDYESYGKLLEKQNNSKYEDVRLVGQLKKTKYLLKIDYNNLIHNKNLYLKDEFKGILSIEVINLSSGSVVYASYQPMNIVKKTNLGIVALVSGIIFLLGIFSSILTKKYYTIKIMSISVFLIILLNLYYFLIL